MLRLVSSSISRTEGRNDKWNDGGGGGGSIKGKKEKEKISIRKESRRGEGGRRESKKDGE